MGSKKGRVERLVYHDLIYLSRGRSTPKLVSGMGLTHTKGIRISVIPHWKGNVMGFCLICHTCTYDVIHDVITSIAYYVMRFSEVKN